MDRKLGRSGEIPRVIVWKSRDAQEHENFINLCRELAVYAYEGNLWTPALVERYREMVDTLERQTKSPYTLDRAESMELLSLGKDAVNIIDRIPTRRGGWTNKTVQRFRYLLGRLSFVLTPPDKNGSPKLFPDYPTEEPFDSGPFQTDYWPGQELRGDDKSVTKEATEETYDGWQFSAADEEPGITFGEWSRRVQEAISNGEPMPHTPPRLGMGIYQLPPAIDIDHGDGKPTISIPLPDMQDGDVVTVYYEPGTVVVHKGNDRRYRTSPPTPRDSPTAQNKGT